ncbi:uncharacterized protein (DUF305 family) [Aeromicrobium panaciterrae]|uniref:Uncharacterized protein (DUF305 family) n=1 Tax=Aeromicrobium panaciterrae TaxID=363861 RepID=A0ABU1UK70_9ACTN|nr:DUF305 domain-containing protein [Aeromicrobium panaciterrae]MDR7085570.1 uncharacterized protein (DUF305 family) [Aeromicrobium panaciterrae]
MKRILLVLIPLLLVVSCAGGTKRDAQAEHNDADVEFAQQMIPHHEQAVEMADLVPGADASPEVVELAAQIKAAQAPEIKQMKRWLKDWGASAIADHDMDHMDMGDGMLSDDELRDLGRATGADFDRLWLTGMIAHHEGAITMAKAELVDGKDTAARKLAQAIIDGQQKEIATMKGLLAND